MISDDNISFYEEELYYLFGRKSYVIFLFESKSCIILRFWVCEIEP
jgi:hypothetical protein